jgi:endonuclease/exonuclease/phosphatase family metal-dependent hydrolase
MTGTAGPDRRTALRTMLSGAVAVPLIASVSAAEPRRATPAAEPGSVPPLKIMTFNLRVPVDTDGNNWVHRRPVMRALLRRTAPHVMGTQEGEFPQIQAVWADMGRHYDWIGTPGSGAEESVAVYYDVRRLTPLEHDVFRLSDTPDVPGSNTWGAAYPRLVTRVLFRDRLGSGEFHVLNTHLDNRSAYARTRAAALIAERIRELGTSRPVLLTGDFNAVAHSSKVDRVYETLLGSGLVDTWDTARRRGSAFGTYTGWKALEPDGDRIDWILSTPDVTVHRAWTDPFTVNGRYPSDHLPVLASVSLG